MINIIIINNQVFKLSDNTINVIPINENNQHSPIFLSRSN